MYRKINDYGQVTIPADIRDEEDGYIIHVRDDGRIELTPATSKVQPIN